MSAAQATTAAAALLAVAVALAAVWVVGVLWAWVQSFATVTVFVVQLLVAGGGV